MANESIESLPEGSIIGIVDQPSVAEPILRWAQAEACWLGWEAALVFAPAFDELAPARWGPALERSIEEVEAVVDRLDGHHGGTVPFITRPKSSAEGLRAELLLREPRLLVVGPAGKPVLAQLLFAPHGPGGLPVALVPALSADTARPGTSRRLLTVGFHESPAATNALQWAVTEAELSLARVRAVVVWSEDQLARLSGGLVVSSHRFALPGRSAKWVGAQAVANSGVPLDRVSSAVLRGSPTHVLVREAASSDLLVIGASPNRVHDHPVLGAIAAGCVTRSPVPVVVVPAA